jgi:hypothetical protein
MGERIEAVGVGEVREALADTEIADSTRDRDCEGESDGDAASVGDGDANTAAPVHVAFVQANVCVRSAVNCSTASTSANAPSSSSVCVAARVWQLGGLQKNPPRLVKTTDCNTVGTRSVTCQNSLVPLPRELYNLFIACWLTSPDTANAA